jgi:hypothetical protein
MNSAQEAQRAIEWFEGHDVATQLTNEVKGLLERLSPIMTSATRAYPGSAEMISQVMMAGVAGQLRAIADAFDPR